MKPRRMGKTRWVSLLFSVANIKNMLSLHCWNMSLFYFKLHSLLGAAVSDFSCPAHFCATQAAFTITTVFLLVVKSGAVAAWVCLYSTVDDFWRLLLLQLSAPHLFCILLNTLKSCRRSWSLQRPSPSRPAPPLLALCPRSSWTRSPATREQHSRGSLPLRRLQVSGRAGGKSCLQSLGSHILNKWGQKSNHRHTALCVSACLSLC